MKKLFLTLSLFLAILMNFSPVMAADKPARNPSELSADQKIQLERIKSRVDEIKSMDKSNLTKAERKDLKKELKEMKNQARALSDGVYLSVGAIIIIILLLIIIF